MADSERLFDLLTQSSRSIASRYFVKSAFAPLIPLCATVMPTCFIAAYCFRDDAVLKTLLVVIGILPPLVACAMYVYFAVSKTDKLQSEEYQIRQEVLELVARKGGKIVIEPLSLPTIANLPPGQIEHAGESP